MTNLEIACLLSVYKTLDYSATAEVLGMTPRALMQNLKRLEEELGFSLFFRDARGLRPTLAGVKFHDFFLARGKDLLASSRMISGQGREAALSVGWCDWLGCPEWLAGMIRRFKQEHPDIKLRVSQAPARELKEMLYNGEMDIALTSHITSGSLRGQVFGTSICNLPLYALLSKAHPGVGDSFEPEKLSNMPHIASYLDDDTVEAVSARCMQMHEQVGIKSADTRVLPNWGSVYTEVNMQNGFTLSPANNLVRQHDCFKRLSTGYSIPLIALRPVQVRSEESELFFEALIKEARQRHE